MKIYPTQLPLTLPELCRAAAGEGISLTPCQNDFQWCFWIPAKCNSNGALSVTHKNAHDLALHAAASALKTLVQSAECDLDLVDGLIDLVVRNSDQGCYVCVWGEQLLGGDAPPRVWGGMVLNPLFMPVRHLVAKMRLTRQTALHRQHMEAICAYLQTQLSIDYGQLEQLELQKTVRYMADHGIVGRRFCLLPRQDVPNPISAGLLSDQQYDNVEALLNAIALFRQKKPALRAKIKPVVYVSSAAMKKLKSAQWRVDYIEVHS